MVEDVQATLSQLQRLKVQLKEVHQETKRTETGQRGDQVAGNGGCGTWEGVRTCAKETESLVEQVCEVDRLSSYLSWVRYVQQIW